MAAEVRHELRCATTTGRKVVKVLRNRRKNGELFDNLLHLSSLQVGNKMYILGLQADLSKIDVNTAARDHVEELGRIVDEIFAANVDTWASVQAVSMGMLKPGVFVHYSLEQLKRRVGEEAYVQARDSFVCLPPAEGELVTRLCYTNTFLEVRNIEGADGAVRRISSEPSLSGTKCLKDATVRLPASALRDCNALGGEPVVRPPSPEARSASMQPSCSSKVADDQDDLEDGEEVPLSKPDRPSGGLLSIGSELHPNGCVPCSFFCYSTLGCLSGEQCTYCHMDHPKRTRRRGKKKAKGACMTEEEVDDKDSEPPQPAKPRNPVPTPAALVPLLACLEHLLPLPMPRLEAFQPGNDTGWVTFEAPSEPPACPKDSQQIGLHYTESTVVLATSQGKQILPFVSGPLEHTIPSEPCVFSVDPPLPKGLMLHRQTGMIRGIACSPTEPEGRWHKITMTCGSGSASANIHMLVVDSRLLPNAEAPN
eukprot:gnl/TRDRNA2_/TRDRNA2_86365_c0_seq1.p1 gnl/TRDRNA2_/TRDRNA2_86365_c0~~gnl/TRDRNA2_/TRDRNA2_86365_c0_seq1.p1  ORF type:complete len:494 (-),score=69.34 gnl/TRDRNA2_/TRDRNA2_86365_c0_seq1:109-1551(-)